MEGISHVTVGIDLAQAEWEGAAIHSLASGTSFPVSPAETDLFYRSDEKNWYLYNGSDWKILTSNFEDFNLDDLVQTSGEATGTPTATVIDTDLTEDTDEHYKGLVMIFTSGNLAGQSRIIAAYDGTTKEITVHPAFTEAPVATDIFVIYTGNYLGDIHDDLATHITALTTHDTDIKTDIGDFSAQSNLTSLLDALGIPDVAGKSLYVVLVTDRLDDAAFGLSALDAELEDIRQKATSPAWNQDTDSLEAIREALDTHDVDLKADIGDFSGQSNLTTLLAALGIPDVAGKDLYTVLITDRLDHVTYGLSAIETLVDGVETQTDKLSGSDADTQTSALDLNAAEQTIFTFSTTTRKKIHDAFLSIVNCTATATITANIYLTINSVEVLIDTIDITAGADPDGVRLLRSPIAVTGNLRVTLQSDNGGDTSVVVPYQYISEDME